MRHLLNTLYILTDDRYLALEGENIVLQEGERTAARFPLHTLEGIACFGYRGISPALMAACAERDISLCFYTPEGRFQARVCGEIRGNVLLRRQQFRTAEDPAAGCRIARSMLIGKVYNCRRILERALRDHELRLDAERVRAASAGLASSLEAIRGCTDPETLRGLEGEAASRYFGVWGELVLRHREVFRFDGRSRRPPADPANALLSFAYSLLSKDCVSALEGAGLDAYVGFLHRDRPGRPSLALDLMEELRGPFADRFVLRLINEQMITGRDFDYRENGAVFLNEAGRKRFLEVWQTRKRESVTHPFLREKLPWGLIPFVQALLLARMLRGDLEDYPPFLWK